ncbi:adenosine receptor A1 [Schistocerca cancellata]|uniref:adenosine receptor A1 n=1 Tax=Schistocerca cancellata TaxID=274614 RepID=UPI002118AAD5|nr:adenosine receptor A1 [Schistocerca cancellata]
MTIFCVPCALLAAVGQPRNLRACLSTLSLLLALCTSSILSLVAVSLDRYWAILHPLVYSRHMRTRTSLSIICACWAAGLVVGLLPVLGWHQGAGQDARCVFDEIMDHGYLVFVYFATIVAPVLLLAFFYAHIYQVVRKQ